MVWWFSGLVVWVWVWWFGGGFILGKIGYNLKYGNREVGRADDGERGCGGRADGD